MDGRAVAHDAVHAVCAVRTTCSVTSGRMTSSYLMSPNFLVRALPRVLKAADVFCPAVDSVSEVFL